MSEELRDQSKKRIQSLVDTYFETPAHKRMLESPAGSYNVIENIKHPNVYAVGEAISQNKLGNFAFGGTADYLMNVAKGGRASISQSMFAALETTAVPGVSAGAAYLGKTAIKKGQQNLWWQSLQDSNRTSMHPKLFSQEKRNEILPRNKEIKLKVQNPGGKWLKREQKRHDAAIKGSVKLVGGMENPTQFRHGMYEITRYGGGGFGATAWFPGGDVMLPVAKLFKFTKGTNQEHKLWEKRIHNTKYDRPKYVTYDDAGKTIYKKYYQRDLKNIKEVIEKEGWNPHSISMSVDHRGRAYINEGNHRLMAAKELGIKEIPVQVVYTVGGEAAKGPWSPDKIIKMHYKNPMEKGIGGITK